MSMENFLASNMLCFDSHIHFEYNLGSDHYGPGYGDSDFCLVKPDRLGFVMELELFDFAFPFLSIYWSGVIVDQAAGIIRWTPDGSNMNIPANRRPIGQTYFSNSRVTAIDGELLTKIDNIDPFFDDINGLGERMFRTSMTFIGDNNFFRFWEQGNTGEPAAGLKILGGTARCGEPVPSFTFDVNIHTDSYRQNACGERALIMNTPASFRAGISNVVSLGRVRGSETKYSWEFAYLNARGGWDVVHRVYPSANRDVSYTPDRTGVLRVTATVDATTDSTHPVEHSISSASFRMTVEDAEGFFLSSAICNLRRNIAGLNVLVENGFGETRTIGGIRIIDPLWDPTPESLSARAARKPLTSQRLQQIQRNMERTAKYTAEIIGKTAKLIEVRQKEEAVALKKQLKEAKAASSSQKQTKTVKQQKPVM
jgi:hypothetical protein